METVYPGMTKVKIKPQLADLDWAEGVVPTPHGDIFLHWDKTDDGVRGYVELPKNVNAEIEVNGETVFVKNGGKFYTN